jgi:nickel superoxide dismutase
MTMQPRLTWLAIAASLLLHASFAAAHCQLPCGIYDDPLRFSLLKEHIATIEKSIIQIKQLAQAEQPNLNQATRWVNNKEAHADKLAAIVTEYFLAQRIKPSDPAEAEAHATYLRRVTWLHEMIVFAMQSKQSTNIEHCVRLRTLVDMFEADYLGKTHAAAHPAQSIAK